MNNVSGLVYEDMTIDQKFDYGFRTMSERDIEKMKNPKAKIEYVQPKRPKIGD
ncbi:hypothetical protein D3C87_2114270 [compost metagenome]